jgi:urease accessory protein
MLTIAERAPEGADVRDRLILPFELRRKSRLRTRLESGREAALLLERGTVLHDGDRLLGEDGTVIAVVAAGEAVATVTAADPLQLLRAAYHLGNRHIPLQVGPGWLRLEQDHVLEHMLEHLGVSVLHENAPFEPESGAYGGGHHHHDDHDHEHEHEHEHGHDHD